MKKIMVLVLVSILVIGAGVGISACYYLGSRAAPVPPRTSMLKFTSSEDFIRAFKNGQTGYGFADELGMPFSANKSVAPGARSGETPEHSTTNVQVAGVDEADIVKNDGKYIYAISGQTVVILDAYPPEKARIVSKIDFGKESRLTELFIEGERLVAVGSNQNYYYETRDFERREVPPRVPATFIRIYDIASREEPRLLRNIEYEGDYSTSRKIKDNVYVVLTSYPDYALYEKKDLQGSDIVPGFRDTREGENPGELVPAIDCLDVECVDPERFSSFLSILAISLKEESKSLSKRVIAGGSENVYASLENLYVASTDYQYRPYRSGMIGQEAEKTTIFKFKLDGPRTNYLASAEVPGTVLNQFSMDESGGYFRIATTRGQVSREGSSSTNNVYVLDSRLEMAGKLEGLAPGEEIYSARFMGDRAYLVTFKKVDPFFVLDLSDPGNPKVLGALKIPGYSDYLHPYDENHIIGIGKNTMEANPEEGNFAWYQGIKIAIFDVSDFAHPREMFKADIGDRGTDSYALNDHKAFLFDRDKNLLVLPVLLAELDPEQKASQDAQAFDYGKYTYQGAYVYDISLENGIRLKGRVTHLDDPSELTGDYGYYDSDDAVKRSLYIGNSLYTVSDATVKINNLGDLAEEASIHL